MFHHMLSEMFAHNPEDINNLEHITEESCCCMLVVVEVVVLQQCGLFWLTFVFWNFNIIGLLILKMKVRVTTV